MTIRTPTTATFTLDYMSVEALAHLANAAAVEINDCAHDQGAISGTYHAELRKRFDAIVAMIEQRRPEGWNISDHVVAPQSY